jgi:aminopeptidase-like protein
MYNLAKRLFPICRSITGNGVRQTLSILREYIPLNVVEVPSGTRAFDWTVPDEWNITDAYVNDEYNHRVIDFRRSNLHVVGYSHPVKGWVSGGELMSHLHTLTDKPTAIPYVTSYYNRTWGFCLPFYDLKELYGRRYYVCVDSTLRPGSLTYGELIIPGESRAEILLSTYTCHPSLANDNLSGVVMTTFLAQELLRRKNRYTYRIIFIPETIGAIVYLSRHYREMQAKTIAGYAITCVGTEGRFSYVPSRHPESLTNRATYSTVRGRDCYDYSDRGSDERQYCSPGIDLPVGSLMRQKYHVYRQYHTSDDNLSFISEKGLQESLAMYLSCLDTIENNREWTAVHPCEPQLGRRGLYNKITQDFMAHADGSDLLTIAGNAGLPMDTAIATAKVLHEQGLII